MHVINLSNFNYSYLILHFLLLFIYRNLTIEDIDTVELAPNSVTQILNDHLTPNGLMTSPFGPSTMPHRSSTSISSSSLSSSSSHPSSLSSLPSSSLPSSSSLSSSSSHPSSLSSLPSSSLHSSSSSSLPSSSTLHSSSTSSSSSSSLPSYSNAPTRTSLSLPLTASFKTSSPSSSSPSLSTSTSSSNNNALITNNVADRRLKSRKFEQECSLTSEVFISSIILYFLTFLSFFKSVNIYFRYQEVLKFFFLLNFIFFIYVQKNSINFQFFLFHILEVCNIYECQYNTTFFTFLN